jgi:ABC-2 type transport system permease protein
MVKQVARMRDVTTFEVLRTLRKKSFWYSAIAVPILIIAVYGVSYLSDSHAKKQAPIPESAKMAMYDASGLVNKTIAAQQKVGTEPSQQAGIAAVKNGSLDAFFYYPKNVARDGISLYEKDAGLVNGPPYDALAQTILKESVAAKAIKEVRNPEIVVILGSSPSVNTMTYKNGAQTNDFAAIVVPGVIMVVFLMLIVLLSYLMIASTTEEKENRVAEILLTSIKSRTLILGKIMAIFALGVVQLCVLVVPLIVLYLKVKNTLTLPGGITLSQITFDPTQITIALLALALGMVMFTGLLVGLGSLFPSAQDAGRFLGVGILWVFIPIYTLGYILTSPGSLIVSVFTYFPLTATTTLMLRNTFGSITLAEAAGPLAILAVCAVLAIMFAVRAFKYSAMEYGRRVSIKELFR